MADLRERLGERFRSPVSRVSPLHGGMVADVQLVELVDGRRLVAKSSAATPLSAEGRMLEYLRSQTELPVPRVLESSDDLLVMEYVDGGSGWGPEAERHAAELLAELHSIGPGDAVGSPSAGSFGFHFDTLIGPFEQRNAWNRDWAAFYRSQRLEPMLELCLSRGRLDSAFADRCRPLLDDLPGLLDHSPRPGLIHGDVWSCNVLARGGRIAAFLDPAIYFADPEIEHAFIDLFSTFGPEFWRRYEELRGIDSGYRRMRRDLYQLYPLLVHVALFGGGYSRGVEERLRRLGY